MPPDRLCHRRRILAAAAAVALGLTLAARPGASVAQEQGQEQGPAARAGEQLDRLLGDLQRNFQDLSDDVRRRFAEAKGSVEDLGVEARVYSRIHWDKALSKAEIAVEVQPGNVVVLHGTLADAGMRRKAVLLAVETVGVERVQDNLRVAESPEGARP